MADLVKIVRYNPVKYYNIKNHIIIIIIIGILSSVLLGFYMLVSEYTWQKYSAKQWVIICSNGVLTAYINYLLTEFLNRTIPWKTNMGSRFLVGIFFHFLASFLVSFFMLYAYAVFYGLSFNFLSVNKWIFTKLAIILFIFIVIFQVIYLVLFSYYSYSHLQIEKIRQERKQVEYQLNALKSQLNPHFLFNSLNTISSLIYKDKRKAIEFIRKLASMCDYTLNSYRKRYTTIKEELRFLESYNYLIETRFEKKYNYDLTISKELLRTKIPPLTLQMLVENAVKHNIMSDLIPLKVSISFNNEYIIVSNNITSSPTNVKSLKIGLKNINARYLLLFGKGIVTVKGEDFVVKLPIIR